MLTLVGQNVDMSGDSSLLEIDCCKTNEKKWPRDEIYLNHKEWRHSDYKDVPYQHVFKFYNKIVQLSDKP